MLLCHKLQHYTQSFGLPWLPVKWYRMEVDGLRQASAWKGGVRVIEFESRRNPVSFRALTPTTTPADLAQQWGVASVIISVFRLQLNDEEIRTQESLRGRNVFGLCLGIFQLVLVLWVYRLLSKDELIENHGWMWSIRYQLGMVKEENNAAALRTHG